MIDSVIKFIKYEKDLEPADEMWVGMTYDDYKSKLTGFLANNMKCHLYKNAIYSREGVFNIMPSTTINELHSLMNKIKDNFKIECLQCVINRATGTAHVLFGWFDWDSCSCIHLQRNEQVALSILIIRTLSILRPDDFTPFRRGFLIAEYEENTNIFKDIIDKIDSFQLTKKENCILMDSLLLVQQMCKGKLKY